VAFVLHQEEQHLNQQEEHEHNVLDHEPKDLDQERIIDQADFQYARNLTTMFADNTRSGPQVIALKAGSERIVNRCVENADKGRSRQEQHRFHKE